MPCKPAQSDAREDPSRTLRRTFPDIWGRLPANHEFLSSTAPAGAYSSSSTSEVRRRALELRDRGQRVGSCGFVERLRGPVELVVRPVERPVLDRDLGEPGGVSQRLEDALPLVVGERDVADGSVLEQQ